MYLFFISGGYNGTTIVYRMIHSSPNVTTMMGKNKSHAGEGLASLHQDPEWTLPNYLKWRTNPEVELPMDHIHDLFNSKWDHNKYIKCSKDCDEVCLRWKQWHEYWSSKGPCKYICMIRDPRTHRGTFDEWKVCAEKVKEALESDLDTILIKYEDLSDPVTVKNRLLKWCPELCSLDINNIDNSGVPYCSGQIELRKVDRCTIEKTLGMSMNKELLNYFGYY